MNPEPSAILDQHGNPMNRASRRKAQAQALPVVVHHRCAMCKRPYVRQLTTIGPRMVEDCRCRLRLVEEAPTFRDLMGGVASWMGFGGGS